MARLTISDAEDKARKGRPWSFRLEFVGSNPANKSGWSDKYWYATGRGINEPVEIAWGVNGHPPHGTRLTTWSKISKVVPDKRANGYDYADHGYVRMSAKSIAKLGGATASAPAPAQGGGKAKAPQGKPAPLSQHPLGNPGQAPQTTPAPVQATKTPSQVSSDLLALGEPWSLIRLLKVIRKGTTVTGYAALDASGDELLKFDPNGGVDFAREYELEIEWV